LIVVGADAIAVDGAVVNKIGTAQIAHAAHEARTNVIVAAETYKFAPRTILGELIEIEERDTAEVLPAEVAKELPFVRVRNPAFDVTPAEYVDLIVTEQGSGTSAGEFQPSQPPFVEDLKVGLNRREPVTITFGALPFSKSGSRTSLADFTAATADQICERHLYPNGSLIGFGYDIDGYLQVSIWNGPPPPENVSSVEAVYALLDGWAEEMGTKNIPVKFTVFQSPPELVIGPQKDLPGWMRLCCVA
jgi:hypothetical protein